MRILMSIFVLATVGLMQLGAATAEMLPVSAYSKLPNVQSVTISPDGSKLAMLAGNTRDERSIIIVPLDGSQPVRIPTGGEVPLSVTWYSNDRIGVFFKKFVARLGGKLSQNEGFLILMNTDGTDQFQVSASGRVALSGGLVSRLPEEEEFVLIPATFVQRTTSRARSSGGAGGVGLPVIYKMNVRNGKGSILYRGDSDTVQIYLDQNNEPFARLAAELKTNSTEYFEYFRVEVPDGNSWKTAFELTDVEVPNGGLPLGIVGFSEDRSSLYAVTEGPTDDKTSLYEIDLNKGTLEKIFSRPDVSISSLGTTEGRFLGVGWFDDVRRTNYFVSGLQGLQEQLQAALPGSVISINDWDQAKRKFVVRVSGGTIADSYFLFDGQTGQLSLIADRYPDVPGNEVGEVRYIKYNARDGLEIPAYVTLPVGRELKDLPMVMLPHGGPESRDNPGFDFWPQMLANRGYVVMQPQYRGSAGFGQEFTRLGDKQWGRKMQTDLTDGVQHLVSKGWVDPDRVCIFGWSYGGYAAMAGATLDAETYRCTVAGAGVSDLEEMLNYERNRGGLRMMGLDTDASFGYWSKVIGDIIDDRELVRRMSPARNIDKVDGPLLLIHGENDDIVPIEQSEIMFDAMKDAGKPVEFVRLKNEDHNITFGETRLEMMTALDNFMRQHNPPN